MEKLKNSLVVQSNKLIEASYRLRIGQQKFLRLMASMIKKDDEDFKSYEFKISDVMELFDVKNKSSYTEIPKQLRELMGNVLTFKIGKTTTIVPFLALAQHDEGSGIIRVQFHPVLKPMYLCLNKENPFTIYELSNALKLRSIYSLRFYELLKQYQKIGSRTLRVEDIRELFELQPNEYIRYNDFKRKVILQAQKEINYKTDITFDFEEIKTGRKVTSLKFYIKSNNEDSTKKEISAQLIEKTNEVLEDPQENEYVKKVLGIMNMHEIEPIEAKKIFDASKGNFEIIERCYKYSCQKKVDNIVAYMIAIVKPDGFIEPKNNVPQSAFNSFNQRQYDFKDLEEKLLGWSKYDD